MSQRKLSRLMVFASLMLVLVLAASPVAAAKDRKPPTNLQVTGMTSYSVSLVWTPSTDNSGSVTYII